MYDKDFIEKLEQKLKQDARAYQNKVTLLAILGNLYIVFGVMVLLILLILACLSILFLKALAIKIIIVVAVFLYMVARSLWVSVEKPQGIELKRNETPELFKIIDGLSRQLNSPVFHHVLVTEDFNAAVVQRPRLGLLGWYENYLIIGLPLMQSLSVEQLTSVLAHEFGHLSRNHARTANRIYRQRIRWSQLYAVIEQNSSRIDFIFRPFFRRFVPYFAAYSFPIARANEYEADKISVQLTSAETVAETLSTVNVIGCYLNEKYWPAIFSQAETLSEPGISPYTGYIQQLSEYVQTDKTDHWLSQSLNNKTDLDDTHPSLSDRLNAIGQSARVSFTEQGQTADILLGQRRNGIVQSLDRKWQMEVLEGWQQHHAHILQQKQRLAELNEKVSQQTELSFAERFEHIELTDQIAHLPEDAFKLAEQLYSDAPDQPQSSFLYGQYLIQRKDERGVAVLERTMQLNEFSIIRCAELLYQYFDEQENQVQAEKYMQLLQSRAELEFEAMCERDSVSVKDAFIPHALTAEQLEELTLQLTRFSNIKKVWLVRKQMQFLSHVPCYVVGFSIKRGFANPDEDEIAQTVKALHEQVVFPGETFILNVDHAQNKALIKK